MIRKAVIPAAGFGTRFLPATKSQPKEMLPVVDTPVIQHVVEEAVKSGITDILMVIGKSKRAIEEHFDRNFELETELKAKNKLDELAQIHHVTELANIHFVWQKQMNGLGDAIYCAKNHVGNEPFAVLLGDTILSSDKPVTKQMMEIYDQYGECVVALEEVPDEKVSRYGIVQGKEINKNLYLIDDIVEKPSIEEAPSNLAVSGRYIFNADIFDKIEKTPRGKNNEVQITDAMRLNLKEHSMYGFKFEGKRHDIGNILDYIKTNIFFGLRNDTIKDELSSYIKELAKDI